MLPEPCTTAPVTPIPIPEFSMNENMVSFVILLEVSLDLTCPILSLSAKLTAASGSSSLLSTLTFGLKSLTFCANFIESSV